MATHKGREGRQVCEEGSLGGSGTTWARNSLPQGSQLRAWDLIPNCWRFGGRREVQHLLETEGIAA